VLMIPAAFFGLQWAKDWLERREIIKQGLKESAQGRTKSRGSFAKFAPRRIARHKEK